MNGTQVREKLRSGERVYGTHIASLMNPMAAMMATQLELDFAFFCTEHMPLDRTEVSTMCHLYASRGISPIVRVPSMDAAAISMAMDGGADGIVVPYIETVDEVRRAVGAVKHRPIKGALLREVLSGERELPTTTRHFLESFNRNNYLIIGVESVPAIEALDELIAVEGVDGVFLGPHDITVSMGIPTEYENPLFIDTLEDVIRRCRAAGVGVGLHYQLLRLPPQTLSRLLDAGMNWIINGADIVVMCDEMNQQLRRLRAMGQDAPRHAAPTGNGRAVQSCIA